MNRYFDIGYFFFIRDPLKVINNAFLSEMAVKLGVNKYLR